MKNIVILAIILISTFSYAQSDKRDTKFVYGEKGLEPRHFTVDIKGVDRKELLSKAIDWFNEKYGYSKSHHDKTGKTGKTETGKTGKILSDNDIYEDDDYEEDEIDLSGKAKKSEKLRFYGFTDNAICFGAGDNYSCEGLEYIIELRFRDGDYRFKPLKLTYRTATSKNKQTISLKKHKFHSKDGKIKEGYEKVSSQIEAFLNSLNKSILNYLTDKEQEDER
ncbi:hypothetical protein [Flavivirga spongiicola]|uniref:DUF4468 domain-containing protein n=1 Tax=Flavivirga spongiicola TaxID=421621 RepID=A0ABU7XRF7_9FLAO|nr:hypothetical protein [Flavivirga sp. MEBiC05379]MDO5978355.1 hypothetical protein [Flavivirga sp. MEBiC05379]